MFYINVLYTICKWAHCWTCIIIIHISMSNTIYLRISALTKLNNTLFTNITSLSYLMLCELTQWRHIYTNCCDDTSHSTAPCDLTYSCELAHGRRRQKLPMPHISMSHYICLRISDATTMWSMSYITCCINGILYISAN